MKFSLITAFALIPTIFGEVVKLDDSNFKELTKDKIVFIKFYAPWCGHCKEMAQDWIKLSEIMRDENVLIAEVDCTAEDSEETCDENDVEGFPSLKYGEGGSVLDEYFEDRSFREMYQFAKQNLKRMCSPKSLDLCDEEQKVILDKYMAMSQEEVKIALEAIDDDLEKYEDALEDEIEKLEEDYEKLENSAREKKKNAMDAADYAFAKQILAMKAEGGLGDEL